MRAIALVSSQAHLLQINHVLEGIDSYAHFVFPFVRNILVENQQGKINQGDTISSLIFKALQKRIIHLAQSHLRILFEKVDQIQDIDEHQLLHNINSDIMQMKDIVDNYDESFSHQQRKLLQRYLLKILSSCRQNTKDDDQQPPRKKIRHSPSADAALSYQSSSQVEHI